MPNQETETLVYPWVCLLGNNLAVGGAGILNRSVQGQSVVRITLYRVVEDRPYSRLRHCK